MTDEIPPVHDFSRVDGYLRSRQKVAFLHAVWRPLLAGAAGAGLIIGAVAIAQPKFIVREVEVPRVTMKDVEVPHITSRDVQVDHVIPHDVPIDIPRIVAASPAPRSAEERAFEDSEGWREAVIRGRILRRDKNGFILATDAGEESFYPARTGADGKPELNPSVEDRVEQFINDLGYCRELPTGLYQCVALHAGREVLISQAPVGKPL